MPAATPFGLNHLLDPYLGTNSDSISEGLATEQAQQVDKHGKCVEVKAQSTTPLRVTWPQQDRRPQAKLRDCVCHAIRPIDPSSSLLRDSSSGIAHPCLISFLMTAFLLIIVLF